MVPILTWSGSSADRSTNTPGTQLTSDEIAYARVQARIRHDAATGEQRNARKRDMNQQGEHEQEAGTETHKEMDLDLTRSGNSGGGEHRHAIITTLHQRRQERSKGGHESAREASAANRRRNTHANLDLTRREQRQCRRRTAGWRKHTGSTASAAGPAACRTAGELLRRSSPPPPARFRPPQTLHRLHSSERKRRVGNGCCPAKTCGRIT